MAGHVADELADRRIDGIDRLGLHLEFGDLMDRHGVLLPLSDSRDELRPTGSPVGPDGARATHSPEWYRPLLDAGKILVGDQLMIRCEGGPSISRLETFPPPLEVDERGGVYVLDDDGPVYACRYVFVTKGL